jgi:putative DNA primase/helicase
MIEQLNPNGIPEELKRLPQWVNWTLEERDGKPTKIPLNPMTGGKAMSNNPSTWGSYDKAVARYRECENDCIAGIGFVPTNGYVGVDLDHCRNPETGLIESWAQEIVAQLKSYTEVTPSGTGVRVWVKGTLPDHGRKKGNIEMYATGRFFTVTGQHLKGTPLDIYHREEELKTIHSKIFGNGQEAKMNSRPETSTSLSLSDANLIKMAMEAKNGGKFRLVWEGDWKGAGYSSPSEADLALCVLLAFWTGRNAARIDTLFRQSGLMREKWDERHSGDGRTYGQKTIEKAIQGTTETYKRPQGHETERGDRESENERAESAVSPTESLLNYNLTDAGNAECFRELFKDQYVFVTERKKWLRFDGIKWSEDDQVLLRMLDTVRKRGMQGFGLQDTEKQKSIVKWCLSSESKMKLNAALSIAESMLPQSITSFDADPLILCCANGSVDLRTGKLLTSKKEDWLYKSTNILYDPGAKCERFMRFLEEVFNGDRQITDFIQKAVGYSLTGLTVEQVLFILYGTGANGKSVFLNILGELLGDYSLTTPASTFKDNPYHDGIPNDIARMAGARLVKSIEVKEGTRLNEERIKALTGGDRVTARFLHNEFFEFSPMCKFWIAVNHKPPVRETGEAIWRRLRLIPFETYFPSEKRDPHLNDKLRSELPGVLTWAIEGCLKWQGERLEPLGKVKESTDQYRAESDLIAQFLEEKTSSAPTGKIKAGDLYKAYESWCKERGEFVITGTKFGKRMEEKGFLKKKTDYVYYLGIKLI